MEVALDYCRQPVDDESLRDRNWFLTINNPTDADRECVAEAEKVCEYVIMCKEVGAECGTPHYHLVLRFSNGVRFATVKTLFPRANIQKVRSLAHAIRYCEKDGDFVQHGKRPRLKELKNASPLTAVVTRVQEGATKHELAREFPLEWIRHHRGIESLLSLQPDGLTDKRWFGPYQWPPIQDWDHSWVIVGPAGINKSQFAKCHFEPDRVLVCSNIDDLKRFNPAQHDGIIFDDMDFNHYPRTSQIHLVDQDENRTIHNRYQDVMIPAGTKKIFTCNQMCVDVADAAIRRRVRIMELE